MFRPNQSWSGLLVMLSVEERREIERLNFHGLLRALLRRPRGAALHPTGGAGVGQGGAQASATVTKVQFNGICWLARPTPPCWAPMPRR